jgi:branched-chain amino acid aminotransferase
MNFPLYSHNGNIVDFKEAVVPLSRVEYSYGFGVYETIRVNKTVPLFIKEHSLRLIKSASIIGLEHTYDEYSITSAVQNLINKNKIEACNIKILLVGGSNTNSATLDILCLNPFFVDRKLYKMGAKVITNRYERDFPAAKTLNMLGSYLAYKAAKSKEAYDSLLINRQDCITEGTRTNFFGIVGRELITPPKEEILQGVIRAKVIEVAKRHKYKVVEKSVPLSSIERFDSLFLTSTSSKVLPINKVEEKSFKVSAELAELVQHFDNYLVSLAG